MTHNQLRPVVEIYQESAEFWCQQRAQSPFFEKKYMDWLLGNLAPGDRVLDLGCGSGFPIAAYLIENKMAVTGVDAASRMINFAKREFPDSKWLVADMRTLRLERKFKAIVAWDSFFHLNFQEQEQMFPIFRSHLSPGGSLIFTSGPERGIAVGEIDGNPLFHASFSETEYRSHLQGNGFSIVDYIPQDPDCGGHTIWLARG